MQCIFGAALDLRAALRYVDDEQAVTHVRAALRLLDQAARHLRGHALDRRPVAAPEHSTLYGSRHDDET